MITDHWLKHAFSNPRSEVILRNSGEGWTSAKQAWRLEEIAKEIYNPSRIIGLRPEGEIRVIILDFDHKPGGATSPYWHKNAESSHLLKLQEEVELCGLQVSFLVSSSSGGLHAIVALPSKVKAWLAHWIGVTLLERCGMKEEGGKAEVFPSEIKYVKDSSQANWARSNGVRLPGQVGSKMIAGDRSMNDTDVIYEQLVWDLDNTEECENWQALLEEARKRSRKQNQTCWQNWKRQAKSAEAIEWTAAGQSENNLRRITTLVRLRNPNITCEHRLAELIRQEALITKGFWEFASEETKKELSTCFGWALRWARSSLRKIMQACGKDVPTEKKLNASNQRVFNLSRTKLKNLYEAHPESATWSIRKVSRETGLNRATVNLHKEFWLQLVAHPEAPITGGMPAEPAEVEEQGQEEPVGEPNGGTDALPWEPEPTSDYFEQAPDEAKCVIKAPKRVNMLFLAGCGVRLTSKKPLPERSNPQGTEDLPLCSGVNCAKYRASPSSCEH